MGSQSPNIGLVVPTIGGDAGPAYAQEINQDLGALDTLLGGTNTLNVGGGSNITLTQTQAQNLNQIFTGALTANITVLLPAPPASGGALGIQNNTTGNFTLSVGVIGGGNLQVIPQGAPTWGWTDSNLKIWTSAPQLSPTWQVISAITGGGSNQFIVPLPTSYIRFRLTLQNVIAVGSFTTIVFAMSADGGNSTPSVSTSSLLLQAYQNVAPVSAISSAFYSSPTLAPGVAQFDSVCEIYCSQSDAVVNGTCSGISSSAGRFIITQQGYTAVGNANAVVISCGPGQISGTIIVEGLL